MTLSNATKQVGTIDITPTWEAILPIMLAAVENGTQKGRAIAKEELLRMAKLADLYVRASKIGADKGIDLLSEENLDKFLAQF